MAEAIARVKEMGAIKYNDGNWRLGNKPDDEYWNSMFRHLGYIFGGEDYDPDTGCLHLAHAVWNMCALLELNHPDLPARDDEIWADRAAHWAAEKVKREAKEQEDSPSELDIDPLTHPSYSHLQRINETPFIDERAPTLITTQWGTMDVTSEEFQEYLNAFQAYLDATVLTDEPLDPVALGKALRDEMLRGTKPVSESGKQEAEIDEPLGPVAMATGLKEEELCDGFDYAGFYVDDEKVADIDPASVEVHLPSFNLSAPMPEPEWCPPGCENGVCSHCDEEFCECRGERQTYRETFYSREGKRAWEKITHDTDGMLVCQECGSDVVWHSRCDKGTGYWECECGYDWQGEESERYNPCFDQRLLEPLCSDCQDGRCPSGDTCFPESLVFTIKAGDDCKSFKDLIDEYMRPYMLEQAKARDRKMVKAVDEVMEEMDQGVRPVGEVMEEMDSGPRESPPLPIDEIMRRCAVDKQGNSLYRGEDE
jgi:hypothetical protein